MRIELHEPEGSPQLIELQGGRLTLGRDPDNDVVLKDHQCSRHHAVITQDSHGLYILDVRSRNGVIVNGRLLRQSPLCAGDELRLGNVRIRVLSGPERSATPVMGSAQPESSAVRAENADRGATPTRPPLTIVLITAVWWITTLLGLLAAGSALFSRDMANGTPQIRILAGLLGSLAVVIGVIMGAGLIARASWVRSAHLLLAGAGLASCALTLPAAVVILYFLRPQTERSAAIPAGAHSQAFHRTPLPRGLELLFSAGFVASILIAVALTSTAHSLYRQSRARALAPRLSANEQYVVGRLRQVAAAEDSFRRLCNTGFGDLAALLDPKTVIPAYPLDGPGFAPAALAAQDSHGYRFDLIAEEPMPPATGCPTRRFRRYRYVARPLNNRGRHFIAGPDGLVRMALDRAATLSDPPLSFD